MKRLLFTLLLVLGVGLFAFAQQPCIDRVVISLNEESTVTDTLYCKILRTDQSNILLDNGFSVTALPLTHIIDTVRCFRAMTSYEQYRYDGAEFVEFDIHANRKTAGVYLKKAANSAYWATALGLAGAGFGVAGYYLGESSNATKAVCYTAAGLSIGTAIFFAIRGWDLVYRAGKLLDVNETTSLHLNGNNGVGLSLKF